MKICFVAALASLGLALFSISQHAFAHTHANPETQDPYIAGADAVVNEWNESLTQTFEELSLLPEAAFIEAWQSEHDGWVEKLRAVEGYSPDHPDAERYEARIYYEWALGRLFYPSAHRALADAPDFRPSENYDDYVETIDLTRGDFLDLEEFTTYLIYMRNQASNALKAELGDALNDGTRDLSSRRLANQQFDLSVQCYLERESIDLVGNTSILRRFSLIWFTV